MGRRQRGARPNGADGFRPSLGMLMVTRRPLRPCVIRLTVAEVAEATGRSKHGVYRATCEGKRSVRLPARKLDDRLEGTASELWAWIRDHRTLLGTSAAFSGSGERQEDSARAQI